MKNDCRVAFDRSPITIHNKWFEMNKVKWNDFEWTNFCSIIIVDLNVYWLVEANSYDVKNILASLIASEASSWHPLKSGSQNSYRFAKPCEFHWTVAMQNISLGVRIWNLCMMEISRILKCSNVMKLQFLVKLLDKMEQLFRWRYYRKCYYHYQGNAIVELIMNYLRW